MTTKFGQLGAEALAAENAVCRQIAREISLFGVNDRQRLVLINLLALELENHEHVRAMTQLVRDLEDGVFVSSAAKGEDDGQAVT